MIFIFLFLLIDKLKTFQFKKYPKSKAIKTLIDRDVFDTISFFPQPASFDALRDWCSDDDSFQQATLDPVSPSVPPRPRLLAQSPSDAVDASLDATVTEDPDNSPVLRHKLPRPEQLSFALSSKFPPKVVPIDVSGSGFKRMEKLRQSLIQVGSGCQHIFFLGMSFFIMVCYFKMVNLTVHAISSR